MTHNIDAIVREAEREVFEGMRHAVPATVRELATVAARESLGTLPANTFAQHGHILRAAILPFAEYGATL